jgi:DNA-binding PadR family transcriptional regulator
MERLVQGSALPSADPGLLYRTLRRLEEEGFVISFWDTEGRGPARRLYRVTPEGVEYLRAWASRIERTRERLDRFLAEYRSYFAEQSKEE